MRFIEEEPCPSDRRGKDDGRGEGIPQGAGKGMKLVIYSVCMNAKMVDCIGVVIAERGDNFLVDFEHDGVEFRGWWPKVS